MFARLEARADDDLRRDGFRPDQISLERALDMRYAGQGYEITLPCGEADETLGALRTRFDRHHHGLSGHMAPEEPVEIVSYRVRGIGIVPQVELPKFTPTGAPLDQARRETRTVRLDGAALSCPVYERDLIDVGQTIIGPAILDQLDCTTIIGIGQVGRVDAWKNLIITQEA
jgi:N-methylhydantoinase A